MNGNNGLTICVHKLKPRTSIVMTPKLLLLLLPLLAMPLDLSASIDEGLLALVPAETVVLSGVDATSTKNAQFGQYLLGRMSVDNPDFQRSMEETGFDPRRDLQNFVVAGFGPRQTKGRSKFVILARGTFDQNQIGSAALKRGSAVTSESYGGLTLYVNKGRDVTTAFAFPDTGVAVMGDLASVQEVIDHRSNPSVLDPGLRQRVDQVGNKNDMWFASIVSGAAFGGTNTAIGGQQLNTSQALKSILQSSGGISFGDVTNMSLDATTRSPQDAAALNNVIQFFGNMLQTQGASDPQAAVLAQAVGGMTLQTQGNDVQVSLALTEPQLERLAQAAPKRAH